MLPSTSSPVESAPTPLSLTDNLTCQHQHLGHTKARQVADVSRAKYQISSKVDFGMCGVDVSRHERGNMMPPPDLCAREGQNCGELQRRSSRSCDVDTEATIAQASCDTKFVTGMSQSGDEREDTMEEGAWGLPPHSFEDSSEGIEGSLEEYVAVSTKASLPDLCDTSSGTRSRVPLDSGLGNDCGQDPECNSLSPVSGDEHCVGTVEKTSSESQRDNLCTDENGEMAEGFVCSNVNIDASETVNKCSENRMNEINSAVDNADGSVLSCEPVGEEADNFVKEGEKSDVSDDSSGLEMRNTTEDTDASLKESYEPERSSGPKEDYLIHDNQQISLVACGVTHCDPSFEKDIEMADLTEDEEGVNLIRHNLHHSSHPMFNKWPCYFYITQEHLPSFSIDSHGRHIGSEAPPMFFPSPSVSRPASQLTEEEQVKIAKRMGLITHLPCGIFDGTKKSGECVICMIDFTVGDRVRYLPCMHTYHTECIDDWLMRSFTCPSCLEPVDAALLNTYGSS
ncbi:uncharacterized protein LOC121879861 [Homarus americanus]|uniref:uncharacterized protein LOC121879861 n=1 Tax=Homarus americanus TaxID=6706 RepID=UPI001C4890AF|nr:uncharacterized protein LOC121879861 [Homarus americanus]